MKHRNNNVYSSFILHPPYVYIFFLISFPPVEPPSRVKRRERTTIASDYCTRGDPRLGGTLALHLAVALGAASKQLTPLERESEMRADLRQLSLRVVVLDAGAPIKPFSHATCTSRLTSYKPFDTSVRSFISSLHPPIANNQFAKNTCCVKKKTYDPRCVLKKKKKYLLMICIYINIFKVYLRGTPPPPDRRPPPLSAATVDGRGSVSRGRPEPLKQGGYRTAPPRPMERAPRQPRDRVVVVQSRSFIRRDRPITFPHSS